MAHRGITGARGSVGAAAGGVPVACVALAHRRRVLLLVGGCLVAAVMLFSLSYVSTARNRSTRSTITSSTGIGNDSDGRLEVGSAAPARELIDVHTLLGRLLLDPLPQPTSHVPPEPEARGGGASANAAGSAGATGATAALQGVEKGRGTPAHRFGAESVATEGDSFLSHEGDDSGGSGESDSSATERHLDVDDFARSYLHLDRLGVELEMSLRQQVFCEDCFPLVELETSTSVQDDELDGGLGYSASAGVAARQLEPGVVIYTYGGDDQVSRTVRTGMGWQNEVLKEILWAMEQPPPYNPKLMYGQEAPKVAAAATPSARWPSEQLQRRRMGSATSGGAAVDSTVSSGSASGFAHHILRGAAVQRSIDAVPSVTFARAPVAMSGDGSSSGGGDGEGTNTMVPTLELVESGAGLDRKRLLHQQPNPPLFVDVGANIGWFAMNVAAKGFRVAAFEGMASNVGLMRASICASPRLEGRLRLYSFGLGSREDACYVFSDDTNRGDGITMCGVDSATTAAARVPEGYTLRGPLRLQRLDSVLRPALGDIQVLKVDVEGYEPHVFDGMGDVRAWYITTEFNPILVAGTTQGQHPITFLESLQARGYRLSTTGFQGPWLTDSQLQRLAAEVKEPVSLYGAHNDLFVQHPAGSRRRVV